jgi:hypothetical protein
MDECNYEDGKEEDKLGNPIYFLVESLKRKVYAYF